MNEKKHLFDDPKNIKRVLWLLYGGCIILFVLDFILHRHIVHPLEELPGFYPVYGFIGCVLLVVVAKWMRNFLMRSEDYYQSKAQQKQQKQQSDDGRDHGDA